VRRTLDQALNGRFLDEPEFQIKLFGDLTPQVDRNPRPASVGFLHRKRRRRLGADNERGLESRQDTPPSLPGFLLPARLSPPAPALPCLARQRLPTKSSRQKQPPESVVQAWLRPARRPQILLGHRQFPPGSTECAQDAGENKPQVRRFDTRSANRTIVEAGERSVGLEEFEGVGRRPRWRRILSFGKGDQCRCRRTAALARRGLVPFCLPLRQDLQALRPKPAKP
jgi:hypothetical protein